MVVYLSPGKWNAPCSLYDMMDIPEEIRKYVNDYRINLVSLYEMTEKDFKEFATEIRNVFKFLKASRNADEMENLVKTDDSFRRLDLD